MINLLLIVVILVVGPMLFTLIGDLIIFLVKQFFTHCILKRRLRRFIANCDYPLGFMTTARPLSHKEIEMVNKNLSSYCKWL